MIWNLRPTTMAKEKSKPVQAVGELQASVRPFLKELGFRARAQVCKRTTMENLRSTLESMFRSSMRTATPAVASYRLFMSMTAGFARNWGFWGPSISTSGGTSRQCNEQAAEVFRRIERNALPFFATFETRDAILNQMDAGKHAGSGSSSGGGRMRPPLRERPDGAEPRHHTIYFFSDDW